MDLLTKLPCTPRQAAEAAKEGAAEKGSGASAQPAQEQALQSQEPQLDGRGADSPAGGMRQGGVVQADERARRKEDKARQRQAIKEFRRCGAFCKLMMAR